LALTRFANRILNEVTAQALPPPSPTPSGVGRTDPLPSPLVRFLMDALLHPQAFWNRARTAVGDWVDGIAPVVIVVVVAVALIVIGARAFVFVRDLRTGRSGRRIRILPPPQIPENGGEFLWTVLHGFIRPRWRRLISGQPHLSWETRASTDDVEISIWVPEELPISYVERAVDSAWPGASLIEVDEDVPFVGYGALKSCQMALARQDWLPIGEGPDSDSLRLVLSAMSNVGFEECAGIQILVRPIPSSRGRKLLRRFTAARTGRAPGPLGWFKKRATVQNAPIQRDPTADLELRAAHAKSGSQLWECSIRLFVATDRAGYAKSRVHSLASAFSVFEGLNGFRRRRLFLGSKFIAKRIFTKRLLLSVKELGAIATIPATPISGMESAHARILAPARMLPTAGRALGISNSGISGRPVAISVADARHHVHLLGETGTGKSTLIANLVLQDASARRAAVVIDPKGDLVESILQRLPDEAEDRTCLIDPTDPSVAVGLNVLEGDDPELVVDHIASLFKRIYEHHWGPRSDDILRAACLTLTHIPGATLAEVPLLLTNREWRKAIRYRLNDAVLGNFWDQFDNKPEAQRAQDIAPLMNKLRAFLMRGAIRTIVGQSRPKQGFEELLDQGGLILVRIPKGLLGEDTSRLLGGLVIARIWQACMKRSGLTEDDRSDVALFVDEMHSYLSLPRSFEDLLAEARGYRMSLVLAHQHLGQLNRDVRDALDANARTKIVFACSPGDAVALEKHYSPLLNAYDLARLPAFTAACRPCLGGANGDPFTFRTKSLEVGSVDRALDVRLTSGEKFGVKRSEVDKQITQRQMSPEMTLLPGSEDGSGFSLGRSPGDSAGRSRGFPSIAEPKNPEDPGEAA
jgi:hypothetical protein